MLIKASIKTLLSDIDLSLVHLFAFVGEVISELFFKVLEMLP